MKKLQDFKCLHNYFGNFHVGDGTSARMAQRTQVFKIQVRY